SLNALSSPNLAVWRRVRRPGAGGGLWPVPARAVGACTSRAPVVGPRGAEGGGVENVSCVPRRPHELGLRCAEPRRGDGIRRESGYRCGTRGAARGAGPGGGGAGGGGAGEERGGRPEDVRGRALGEDGAG